MNLFIVSFGWTILGIALWIGLRVIGSGAVLQRGDAIQAVMRIGVVISILFGIAGMVYAVIGWLAWLVIPLMVIVLAMAYHQYLQAERRALASLMMIAAESGTPLDLAAEALAAERAGELGYRAFKLAALLRKGVPLEYAVRKTRLKLPHDEHLALMLGAVTGDISSAVETIARRDDDTTELYTTVLNRLLYFALVLFFFSVVFTFIMLKIVPEFSKMFSEFAIELPRMSEQLIAFSRHFNDYGALVRGVVLPIVSIVALLALLYRVGAIRQDIPLLFFIRRRWHTARLLRALAHGCRQNIPLPDTMRHVYRYDVETSVARRLSRAIEAIENGASWTEALRKQGLLTAADCAVLESAQQAGNLPWAMDELADSNLRRLAHTIRVRMMIITPVAYFAFAVMVGFTVVALFAPLVTLIEHLSPGY